jgi:glycosyltransferase involved in cell wall biosynthesis
MITGDKNFKPGNERYDLQRSTVEELAVVYWGKGSTWPTLPEGKFDVVTVQDPFWRGAFGWWAAKQKRAKFNVQVHTDLSVYTGLKHMVMQIVLRHADSVRVVSQKIKEQVEKIGVTGKVFVLPVFVDITKFKSVVAESHIKPTMLWVGRFEDEKNPLGAIEVYKKVLETIPDAGLVMLGAGTLQPKVALAASGTSVRMPGFQDTAEYLKNADVVLCTSMHESFGASIVEALAAGLPVVAPDVGVAKEAGANVVAREDLASEVIRVLQTKQKGELKLTLLNKEEWAREWAKTLQ